MTGFLKSCPHRSPTAICRRASLCPERPDAATPNPAPSNIGNGAATTKGIPPAKIVGHPHGGAQTAPENHDESQQQPCRPHQAQFLAHHRINERSEERRGRK